MKVLPHARASGLSTIEEGVEATARLVGGTATYT